MKHYLALAVRIFSIFLFLYSIKMLSGFLPFFHSDNFNVMQPNIFLALLGFALPLFLAVVFWMFPKLITKKIYNDDDGFDELNSMPLLATIIAGSGIFYLYYAFSDSLYWFSVLAVMSNQEDPSALLNLMSADYKVSIFVTVLELVLALILIFKCKTIAKFISKLSS